MYVLYQNTTPVEVALCCGVLNEDVNPPAHTHRTHRQAPRRGCGTPPTVRRRRTCTAYGYGVSTQNVPQIYREYSGFQLGVDTQILFNITERGNGIEI